MQKSNIEEQEEEIGQYKVNLKGHSLGKGAYGEVFKGFHSETKFPVAVKVLLKNPEKKLQQVEILKSIQAPNIVRFHGIYENKDKKYCVVYELCDSNFQTQIRSRPHKQYLEQKQILNFLQQVCHGFKVLYQNNTIHRDVKPANILIKKGVYKLADFGFARYVENMDTQGDFTHVGTPLYASPQVLQKHKNYSSKCDIWSLGIILYQLLYFRCPFSEQSWNALKALDRTKDIPIPKDKIKRSKHFEDLVQNMLRAEQSKRIEWTELFINQIILSNDDTVDLKKKQSIQVVYPVLRFYKNICLYIFKSYELYIENESVKNNLQYLFVMGKFLFCWTIVHYCRKIVKCLFSQSSFHPMIDQQSLRIFKTTDKYWKCLHETKYNEKFYISKIATKQNKASLLSISKTVHKNSIPAFQTFVKGQFQKDQKVFQPLKQTIWSELSESTNINHNMKERIDRSMYPTKYFGLDTNFDELNKIQE